MINHRFLPYFLQAAFFCGCLAILGCENDERTLNAWNEKKVMVDKVLNVTSLFSQAGKMRARLKAPLMLRYQTDTVYVEFPKSLHVDFFDSTTRVESWLDARYGKYYESLNKVFLRDSVKVINIQGDTLTTSELWWDQNTKKLYTEKKVRIITKNRRITGGRGLEAAQDLSSYTIRQPTGTVIVGDDILPQQ